MQIKEYLEREKRNSGDLRSEYLNGTVRDLDAEDDVHFGLRMNVAFLLKEHLSSDAFCKIYVADMRTYIPALEAVLYPDILITCDMDDAQQNDYKLHPSVIVEVVSAASGGYDRGQKFACYRRLTGLREYILVDATRVAIDCFRYQAECWTLYSGETGDTVTIPSLDFSCEVDDIYQDIFTE